MTLENSLWQQVLQSGVKLTPMMTQYAQVKEKYPDTFLFFRMGDFYELFFDDAVQVSQHLQITLTHRGKIGDINIPMAGIPYHSAGTYVDRLTSQGYRVAICEQVENPKDAQGIVKREVVQVVGPGIPFDLEKTDASEHRFLATASFDAEENRFLLILLDYTTGDFFGLTLNSFDGFLDKVLLYAPKEFLTFMGQWEKFPLLQEALEQKRVTRTVLSENFYSPQQTRSYIEKLIPNFHRDQFLKQSPAILSPLGALSYYICSTQFQQRFVHLRPFRLEATQGKMSITLTTLRGLEIFPKESDHYRDSLLGFFDKTKTSMGKRELKSIFLTPLTNLAEIRKRQKIVDVFLQTTSLLEEVREELGHIRDFERILAKVTSKKIQARDLLNLSSSLTCFFSLLEKIGFISKSLSLSMDSKERKKLMDLAKHIEETINPELGANLEKGNLIREGVSAERDTLADMAHHSEEALIKLESKYRKKTNISNLKIKYNNISGYFIEVSKSHLSKTPENFIRRQTLVNSERFVTDELIDFEKNVLTAKAKLELLEKELFDALISETSAVAIPILNISRFVAMVDVFQSFAFVAWTEEFACPEIFSDRKILSVEGAWHPLIRGGLQEKFVVHQLHLDEKCYFGLITGPNMAGKTTCMREMAIIQFLSQLGSYVPAKRAHLGLCDHLFSRLGASDDILKGHSTFMVEMAEIAEIIRHATSRSLIILDEVGRGTSTYDGLSIAWALVEHFIHEIKAISLFSTHYHALIDLVNKTPQAKNLTVETQIQGHEVKFLYNLIEGATSQSYGIYVAQMAGLPQSILNCSQTVLNELEKKTIDIFSHTSQPPATIERPRNDKSKKEKNKKFQEIQLCFFPNDIEIENKDGNDCKKISVPLNEGLRLIEKDLLDLDLMNTTPFQALEKLYKMKQQLNTIPLQ